METHEQRVEGCGGCCNEYNSDQGWMDMKWQPVERLEARIMLNSLPVGWGEFSSSNGDFPVPDANIGQTVVLVLDVDKDNLQDYVLVARGSVAPVTWYKQEAEGGWTKHLIDVEQQNLEAGGTFHDVDGDGDEDIVLGGDYQDNHIYWWENPSPVYDPTAVWVRHEIKDDGENIHHNMGFGDVDGDGDEEFVTFNQDAGELLLYEIPEGELVTGLWQATPIFNFTPGWGHEGLAFADMNLDGVDDIVAAGRWFEFAGAGVFIEHDIDSEYSFVQLDAGQLVEGGRPEVVMVAGDESGPLNWYEWNGIGWSKRVLLTEVVHGHGVQVADINQDGFQDIFVGEMGQWGSKNGPAENPDARVYVLYGDGQGNFVTQVVREGQGVHGSLVVDLDSDGDLDIFGKPFLHNGAGVFVWMNEGNVLPLNQWQRHELDGDLGWRTWFVEHGDLDGDGLEDVVTGGWWYRNPGAVSDVWERFEIGLPMRNVTLIYDFDGDGDLDLYGNEAIDDAKYNPAQVWAENDGMGNFTVYTNVQPGDSAFVQGVLIDRFGPNRTGDLEIVMGWEDGAGGTKAWKVGDDPTVDNWDWRLLHPVSQGEELETNDIDGDGDQDIFMGTKWLRNDISKVDNWWDAGWAYRAPISVDVNGYDRWDKPVEVAVDFTALLNGLGENGALDVNSIRVIEVDDAGQPLDTDIAFQFDEGDGFDTALNAAGTLVFMMKGQTKVGQARNYHVYFDIAGKGFQAVDSIDLVAVGDVVDEGQLSFRIDNQGGSYFYQKASGGFSSLIDKDGNDWIGHQPLGGSDGAFRGIPNLVYPEGYLHPGSSNVVTTLVNDGPVKATIHSVTTDGLWEVVWEIYPEYATMTVLAAGHDYWFLYEGTPGGALEVDQDFVVRSDGTATYASQPWVGDLPGEEWVYFADPNVERALYVIHHGDDDLVDSYSALNDEMTVFGFGREGVTPWINGLGEQFTIGLMDETVGEYASPVVRGAYQEMSVAVGNGELASAVATADQWTLFTMFETDREPDRIILADVNQDGLLDAVVTYSIHNDYGYVAWYEQPSSSPEDLWTEHIIAQFDFVHSLDVADIDGDGDLDITTGEHRIADPAEMSAFVYENLDGVGGAWQEHVVYTGDEQHDGMQLFDADGDGDLDIVSIGWINDKLVIYENLAVSGGQILAAQPEISPGGGVYNAAVEVAITSLDGGARIYYTLDGSDPTESSTLYEGSFVLTGDAVVRARSYVAGRGPSDIVEANFTVYAQPPVRVTDGLSVIYEFSSGSGDTVYDLSQVGSALNLTIGDVGAITWGDGVLTVDAETLISSGEVASKIIDSVKASGEITIEAWLSTSDIAQNGPARIVTLSADAFARNFTLGQGVYSTPGSRLDVRLRTTRAGDNGSNPSTSSPVGSLTDAMTHVVYVFGSDGIGRLYMDNVLVATEDVGGNVSNWDDNYVLGLANEISGGRPWLGTFDLVAVYSKALDASEVSRNYFAGSGAVGINEQPIAGDDYGETDEDTVLIVNDQSVLDNDSDPDGVSVSIIGADGSSMMGAVVAVNVDGSYTYDPTLAINLQNLAVGESAVDHFSYVIEDVDGGRAVGVVYVTVNGRNDWPFAADDAYVVLNNQTYAGNVIHQGLDNGFDYDLDLSDVLRVGFVNGLAVDINASSDFVLGSGASLTMAGDGGFSYDPRSSAALGQLQGNESALDSFEYTLLDGQGGEATATAVFTVYGPNASPVAFSNEFVLSEDVYLVLEAAEGVLADDTDAEGDILTARVVSGVQHGVLTFEEDGGFKYVPDANYFGEDEFMYVANDGVTDSNVATVKLVIQPVNDQPVATGEAYAILHNEVLTIDQPGLLGNDSDVDNVILTAELTGDVSNGTLALNPDGGFVYTPNVGFDGIDRFTYVVSDGLLVSNEVEVLIDVGGEPLGLDGWVRHEIDSVLPWRTIFVEHGDLNGDGYEDVVTGGWWYENPGSADGGWTRRTIGGTLNNMLAVVDFDGDGYLDVLGTEGVGSQSNTNLVWAKNDGSGGFTIFDNITAGPDISEFDVDQGFAQGVAVGRVGVDGSGPMVVMIAWNQQVGGTQMLTVPADAAVDQWAAEMISPVTQGEEISMGDIDSDGDMDLLLGTRWLRNDDGVWTDYVLHPNDGIPDRNRLGDIDGDGLLDAVVTFGLHGNNPKVVWYEQPDGGATGEWIEHEVDIVINPQSLDLADVDEDGDIDIVVGEHDFEDLGQLRMMVYENVDGLGGSWTQHVVYTGDEHHDGGQLMDVDNDGDLDIVSIGWVNGKVVLYENRAIAPPVTVVSTPRIVPAGGSHVDSVTVTLEVDTENALIYYTTNGSDPTQASLLYEEAFVLTADATVKARAYRADLDASDIVTADFTITQTPQPGERVTDGLQALYEFASGGGNTVADISGVGSAMDLTIADTAAVTWGDGELTIDSSTLITSTGPASKLIDSIKASGELTVEAWVMTADLNQNGPARMVSISEDPNNRNLTLGQGVYNSGGDRVEVRLRSTVTNDNGTNPVTTTPRGTLGEEMTHVVYTRGVDGNARVYIDGVLVSTAVIGGNLANWDESYSLVIGNEMTGDRPWLGTYDLVAFYDRALNESEVQQNYDAGTDGTSPPVNELPVVDAGIDQQVEAGQLVSVSAGYVDGNAGDTHTATIDWGDGTIESASVDQGLDVASGNHVYDVSGLYTVTVTVVDQHGGVGVDTLSVDVAAPSVVANPRINPAGGTYIERVDVMVEVDTPDAVVRYTTDGSEPTENSELVVGGVVTITESLTLKVKGFADGQQPSETVMADYIIEAQPDRVTEGLQVLYGFDAGSGNTVYDVSGVGDALDLTIADVNAVTWGDGVLSVDAATVIQSVGGADKIGDAVVASGEITIEAWISTSDLAQNGPARIVSLSDGPYARDFTLGQGVYASGSDRIDVRLRTTQTGENGSNPSLSSPRGTLDLGMTHVVYTRDATGQAVLYMDGVVVANDVIGGDLSNWDTSYDLTLANELTGDRPWLGTFDLVAVYSRALDGGEVLVNYEAGT